MVLTGGQRESLHDELARRLAQGGPQPRFANGGAEGGRRRGNDAGESVVSGARLVVGPPRLGRPGPGVGAEHRRDNDIRVGRDDRAQPARCRGLHLPASGGHLQNDCGGGGRRAQRKGRGDKRGAYRRGGEGQGGAAADPAPELVVVDAHLAAGGGVVVARREGPAGCVVAERIAAAELCRVARGAGVAVEPRCEPHLGREAGPEQHHRRNRPAKVARADGRVDGAVLEGGRQGVAPLTEGRLFHRNDPAALCAGVERDGVLVAVCPAQSLFGQCGVFLPSLERRRDGGRHDPRAALLFKRRGGVRRARPR